MKTSTQLALLFGHSQHGQIKLAESASFLYTERGIPSYDSIILVTEYKKTFFFHFCVLSVRFSSRDLCHFKRQFLFSILVLFLVFIFHKWDKDVVFEHCGLLRERERRKKEDDDHVERVGGETKHRRPTLHDGLFLSIKDKSITTPTSFPPPYRDDIRTKVEPFFFSIFSFSVCQKIKGDPDFRHFLNGVKGLDFVLMAGHCRRCH